jgi:hypothetical protein
MKADQNSVFGVPTPRRRRGGKASSMFTCTLAITSKIKTSTGTAAQYLYEGFLVFWSSGLLPLRKETSSPEVQQSTWRILVLPSSQWSGPWISASYFTLRRGLFRRCSKPLLDIRRLSHSMY